jgi:hypothetical protein
MGFFDDIRAAELRAAELRREQAIVCGALFLAAVIIVATALWVI